MKFKANLLKATHYCILRKESRMTFIWCQSNDIAQRAAGVKELVLGYTERDCVNSFLHLCVSVPLCILQSYSNLKKYDLIK